MNNILKKVLDDKWLLQTILQPVSALLFLLVVFIFYAEDHPGGLAGAWFAAFFEDWPLLYVSFSLLVTSFLFTYDEQPTPNRSVLIGFFSLILVAIIAAIIGASSNYHKYLVIVISLLFYGLSVTMFAYMANKNSDYFNKKREEFTRNDAEAEGDFKDVEV